MRGSKSAGVERIHGLSTCGEPEKGLNTTWRRKNQRASEAFHWDAQVSMKLGGSQAQEASDPSM